MDGRMDGWTERVVKEKATNENERKGRSEEWKEEKEMVSSVWIMYFQKGSYYE